MSLKDWFYRYYIEPMEIGTGFNPINTLTYALVLIAFSYVTFGALKKLKIKIDEKLVIAVLPFVLLGSSVRILEDTNVLRGYLFMTPGIWLLFFSITFSILLISIFLERSKGIPYYKTMFLFGIIFLGPVLGVLEYRNFLGIEYIILWSVPWLIILMLIEWSKTNKIITGIHIFDAIVTFVSVRYFGYFEQHFLPRFVIELTGNAFSFVILKFIVIASVLLLLDKYSDDKEFKNWIKIVIGVLGLVPGVRDFLRLVCLA